MILVFDTNVFLQRNANLWELFEIFSTRMQPPSFIIGLDDKEVLEDEYLDQALIVRESDPDAPIVLIVQKILSDKDLFAAELPVHFSEDLLSVLEQTSCTDAVEQTLVGVANASPNATLVCPNDPKELALCREYLKEDVIFHIHSQGAGPPILSLHEVLKAIRQAGEYNPETIADLRAYLQQFKMGDKQSEEREFLEFKGPKTSYLVDWMLMDAVRAVCAMLNSRDGWVVLGVNNDTGEITPFPPRYNSEDKELSVDGLVRDIYAEIRRIIPKPGPLVKAWPILDEDRQKCVIVIYVHRGDGTKHYLYRDKNHDLNKRTKWIRDGPSSVIDPAWR